MWTRRLQVLWPRSDARRVHRWPAADSLCVCCPPAGRCSGLSAETKGVYVLFFLLSALVLALLAVAALLYRRHRRGAFLVRCRSPIDPNNNNPNQQHLQDDGYGSPTDSDLPPPPPPPLPARGFREGWPQVKERCPALDLPLLRFNPLLPPGGYTQPQESPNSTR